MKLLKLDDFLKLPPGTVYCVGEKWYFNGPRIKGNSIMSSRDWFEGSIDMIECDSTEEMWDRLEKMRETGASYPLEIAESRNGLFNEDALFLVYEKHDLEVLRSAIQQAIHISVEARETSPET
jgi:hypothetical protein